MAAHTPREVYALALRNAHSMTAETRTVLRRQADHAAAYPSLAARLRGQADARLARIEGALSPLGGSPSTFKDAVTSAIGAAAEIGHGLAGDTEVKDYFVAASFAGLNHVALRSLKVSAEVAGEDGAWLDAFIREDEDFGRWLYENVEAFTREYTARVARGAAAEPT